MRSPPVTVSSSCMNPKENSTYAIDIPTRDDKANVPSRFPAPSFPSLHWGNEHLWAQPSVQSRPIRTTR